MGRHRNGQEGEVFSVFRPQTENFRWFDCRQADKEQIWEGCLQGEVSGSKETFRSRTRPLVCGRESCPQGLGLTGFCGNRRQVHTREGLVCQSKVALLKANITSCLWQTPSCF